MKKKCEDGHFEIWYNSQLDLECPLCKKYVNKPPDLEHTIVELEYLEDDLSTAETAIDEIRNAVYEIKAQLKAYEAVK